MGEPLERALEQPAEGVHVAAERLELGGQRGGGAAHHVADQVLDQLDDLLARGARHLDVELVELDQVAAGAGRLQGFEPDVGGYAEDLVEGQQRGLLVEDGAGHQLVAVAVEVDVDLLGAARARIGDGPDDRRQQLGEALRRQVLAGGGEQLLLDAQRTAGGRGGQVATGVGRRGGAGHRVLRPWWWRGVGGDEGSLVTRRRWVRLSGTRSARRRPASGRPAGRTSAGRGSARRGVRWR